MNKAQRKELQLVVDKLNNITGLLDGIEDADYSEVDTDLIKSELSHCETVVTDMASSEREKFDNMSEGLQQSETGQNIESAADTLENVTWPELPEELDDETAEVFVNEVHEVIAELENLT
jgi:hypothetical protein